MSLNFLQLEPTLDFQMKRYIYKRKNDGIYIINLKPWEELLLAGRAIVAIESPADVCPILQEAVRKLAAAPGAAPIAGRFSPGPSLTRSGQPSRSHNFWWLQLPTGTSYVHLPTIALCNTDSAERRGEWTLSSHATRRLTWWV